MYKRHHIEVSMRYIILLVLFMVSTTAEADDFIVSHRTPASPRDTRVNYQIALLDAAMTKTIKEYGPYRLIPAPRMNVARSKFAEKIHIIENYVFETSASKENERNLLSIPIPIAKGVFGYRVFLIEHDKEIIFDNITTIEQLKKVRMGQGRSWLDSAILKNAGFTVITSSSYDGLFKMLSTGRFDAFPRAINEAFVELKSRTSDSPGLTVEKNICLYYPLPRFFYTAKKNTLLAERLQKGLEKMIEDGTFNDLWHAYHFSYIEQAELDRRKLFRIDNPFIPENVPLDDARYWYKPLK